MLLPLQCVSMIRFPLFFDTYLYTYTHPTFLFVSSADVALVDLNHFSHSTALRCSVKNSSLFTLSLSIYTCNIKGRERVREGIKSSHKAHTDGHCYIYYSSSWNDECIYIERWCLMLVLLVVMMIFAL